MSGKKINSYLAVLVITGFGSLATLMIVNVATTPLSVGAEFAYVDPFDLNADFGR